MNDNSLQALSDCEFNDWCALRATPELSSAFIGLVMEKFGVTPTVLLPPHEIKRVWEEVFSKSGVSTTNTDWLFR